jgi:hypothetical protein
MDVNVPLQVGGLTQEQALARICAAEGVTPAQVQSIQLNDNEFTARIARPGGGSRIVIYPLITLAGR